MSQSEAQERPDNDDEEGKGVDGDDEDGVDGDDDDDDDDGDHNNNNDDGQVFLPCDDGERWRAGGRPVSASPEILQVTIPSPIILRRNLIPSLQRVHAQPGGQVQRGEPGRDRGSSCS